MTFVDIVGDDMRTALDSSWLILKAVFKLRPLTRLTNLLIVKLGKSVDLPIGK